MNDLTPAERHTDLVLDSLGLHDHPGHDPATETLAGWRDEIRTNSDRQLADVDTALTILRNRRTRTGRPDRSLLILWLLGALALGLLLTAVAVTFL